MKTFCVGNFDEESKNEIRRLLEMYGAVSEISFALREIGVATVTMPDDKAADRAIQGLKGKIVAGRPLKVGESLLTDIQPPVPVSLALASLINNEYVHRIRHVFASP